MKKISRSSKRTPTFATYTIASAAAGLATTHQSEADFLGDYALTPPAAGSYSNGSAIGNFGGWNGSYIGDFSKASLTLDTSAAPTAVSITANSLSSNMDDVFSYSFFTMATDGGTVSFDYSASFDAHNHGYAEYYDGSDYNFIPAGSGMITFMITAGETFGFKTTASYLGMASLTISDFSAPSGAVPENGSGLALLALGFAGLIARRELAARAKTQH